MIDYTQFGAQTQAGTDDETDARKRALAVQQPAGGMIRQPAVQQPSPAQPGPQTGAGAVPTNEGRAPAPTQATTFAQLQAAGIPRPAPPQLPMPTAPAPMAGQERTVDPKTGAVTLSGSGVTSTVPLSQQGNVGGYDPTKPPPGYGDPRAWALNNQDITQRQAHAYVDANGVTQYGRSEGMGDSFANAAEFEQYLASLPENQRQIARFANPKALQMLQAQQAAGAPGTVTPLGTGGPNMQSAGGQPGGQGGQYGGQGGGMGDDIMSMLRQLLQNPTAYGSDAMRREFESGARGIDDDFKLRQKGLTEEMARRGLYDSSIAAGNMSDLNIGQRSAETELMDRLLSKRADAQDGGIRSALSAAMGYDSDLAGRGYRDRSLDFDRERYQGDSQYRDKSFTADQDRWNQQFMATLFELFGGANFGV
jgi:hypothetical protein